MVACIKLKLRFSKYCQDAYIKDVALFNNSLQPKAVNFCPKNSILDTGRGLDFIGGKYDFPITVKSSLPHKWLLN